MQYYIGFSIAFTADTRHFQHIWLLHVGSSQNAILLLRAHPVPTISLNLDWWQELALSLTLLKKSHQSRFTDTYGGLNSWPSSCVTTLHLLMLPWLAIELSDHTHRFCHTPQHLCWIVKTISITVCVVLIAHLEKNSTKQTWNSIQTIVSRNNNGQGASLHAFHRNPVVWK